MVICRLRYYFAEVSVADVTKNEGEQATLSCTYDTGGGLTVSEKKWYTGGQIIPNANGDTLVKNPVAFTDAGDYECEVTWETHGKLKSSAATLSVQGMFNYLVTIKNRK